MVLKRKNSSHFPSRFESQPEVSNLNLSTAGSRRTVYLVDENNKKEGEKATTSNSNGNGNSDNQSHTILMYNKISTTIAGEETPMPVATTNGTNGNQENNQKSSKSDKKKNEKNQSRESAIWYEIFKKIKPRNKSIN